ncbi:MAG: hypothetical protein MUD08_01340 [Cytophagales bacterium]|jgi:hypothetical protein|nr:hypothetical protein [Cytophagales bacterium]
MSLVNNTPEKPTYEVFPLTADEPDRLAKEVENRRTTSRTMGWLVVVFAGAAYGLYQLDAGFWLNIVRFVLAGLGVFSLFFSVLFSTEHASLKRDQAKGLKIVIRSRVLDHSAYKNTTRLTVTHPYARKQKKVLQAVGLPVSVAKNDLVEVAYLERSGFVLNVTNLDAPPEPDWSHALAHGSPVNLSVTISLDAAGRVCLEATDYTTDVTAFFRRTLGFTESDYHTMDFGEAAATYSKGRQRVEVRWSPRGGSVSVNSQNAESDEAVKRLAAVFIEAMKKQA